MRVAVTGGSGKAGRATVRELLEQGHRVLNIDLVPDREPVCPYLQADMGELGQAFEVLRRQDAVIHLAAIPRPGLLTEEATFRVNTTATFNVFTAACQLGLSRIVWASSETTLGLPFDDTLPYFPVDEEQPTVPKSSYALSKVLSEEMARYFNARFQVPIIGLRISNIFSDTDYAAVPSYQHDPRLRSWNGWGYVDSRDVAQACRLSIESDLSGAEVFIIAAADTIMERTNAELVSEVFPNVPLREGPGEHGTLLAIGKARRLLGYEPQHSWRDR
jgi:nucleoside-diphosphate-sugar epimerase